MIGPFAFYMVQFRGVGEITEGVVLAEFVKRGIAVLIPFGYAHRYDFVVEVNGLFVRLQCKTGRRLKDGRGLRFNSCSTSNTTGKRRDYRGQIDYFAVHDPSDGSIYLIPPNLVGKADGTLRFTVARKGRKQGLNMAAEYEISSVLSALAAA